ncbi:zinc-binding dehydrogenase [Specibacter sp. RAF43]|uniref:zinc-binding dehydrogenase n=1 Tax=Specibacter sp. RAF43 TaxID=3233057 RepID=UPI003F97C3DA
MKAHQLVGPTRLIEIDAPTPRACDLSDGQVLVRMVVAGICGSDLPAFSGKRSPSVGPEVFDRGVGIPGYPCHELVAEVVASADPGFSPGQMVVGWASNRDGLAEYVVTSGQEIHAYDARLTPERAILIQPLACVLHALQQLGDVSGRTVTILGLGPIGLLFAHAAKARGARWVVGVDRVDRSEVAAVFGLDEVVHLSSNQWAGGVDPEDATEIVVEAVGHQVGTLSDALAGVAVGGRVFYFGIPDDPVYPLGMDVLLRKNLTLQAGFVLAGARREALREGESYLQAHPGLAEVMSTHIFTREYAAKAYEAATVPKVGQHKVVITFP